MIEKRHHTLRAGGLRALPLFVPPASFLREIWYTKKDKIRLREKGAADRMQAERFSGVLRRALQSTAWFAAALLVLKLLLFRNIGWTGYAVAAAVWLGLELARGYKASKHPDGKDR